MSMAARRREDTRRIQDSHVRRLARILQTGGAEELDLQQCGLKRRHLEHLVTSFRSNSSLTSLCIAGNPLGDDGLLALLRAVEGHRSLGSINVSECRISDVGLRSFLSAVKSGRLPHKLQEMIFSFNRMETLPERIADAENMSRAREGELKVDVRNTPAATSHSGENQFHARIGTRLVRFICQIETQRPYATAHAYELYRSSSDTSGAGQPLDSEALARESSGLHLAKRRASPSLTLEPVGHSANAILQKKNEVLVSPLPTFHDRDAIEFLRAHYNIPAIASATSVRAAPKQEASLSAARSLVLEQPSRAIDAIVETGVEKELKGSGRDQPVYLANTEESRGNQLTIENVDNPVALDTPATRRASWRGAPAADPQRSDSNADAKSNGKLKNDIRKEQQDSPSSSDVQTVSTDALHDGDALPNKARKETIPPVQPAGDRSRQEPYRNSPSVHSGKPIRYGGTSAVVADELEALAHGEDAKDTEDMRAKSAALAQQERLLREIERELQQRAEQLERDRSAYERNISNLAAELQQLRSRTAEERVRTAQLDDREQSLSARESLCETHERHLEEREHSILAREQDIESRLQTLRQLQNQQTAARTDLENLEKQARAEQEKLEAQRYQVEKEYRTLEQEKEKLAEMRKGIEQRTSTLDEREQSLVGREKARSAAIEDFRKLQESTRNREEELEREEADIRKQKQAITSARDDLAEQKRRLEILAREHDARERDLRSQEERAEEVFSTARQELEEVRNAKEQLAHDQRALREQNDLLKQQQDRIHALEDRLRTKDVELERKERMLAEKSRELDDREEEIGRLQAQQLLRSTSLDTARKRLHEREAAIESVEDAVHQRQQELEQLKEGVTLEQKNLREWEAALSAREREARRMEESLRKLGRAIDTQTRLASREDDSTPLHEREGIDEPSLHSSQQNRTSFHSTSAPSNSVLSVGDTRSGARERGSWGKILHAEGPGGIPAPGHESVSLRAHRPHAAGPIVRESIPRHNDSNHIPLLGIAHATSSRVAMRPAGALQFSDARAPAPVRGRAERAATRPRGRTPSPQPQAPARRPNSPRPVHRPSEKAATATRQVRRAPSPAPQLRARPPTVSPAPQSRTLAHDRGDMSQQQAAPPLPPQEGIAAAES